jgi:glycosyltransferase involved in cell wall biosynthesis
VRVLHVIPAVATRYGGPSDAVLRMCHALDARGVHAVIATSDADGPERLPVTCGIEQIYQGVRTIFFSRVDERFKYTPNLAVWLGPNSRRFDVVHIHAVFSHASLAAARVCRRERVPYVLRPLGSLDPWGLGRNRVQKRVLRLVAVDRLLRDAAAVHFTTDEERRLAEQSFRNLRSVVIPLGVDDTLLTQAMAPLEDRPASVVTIGRLHPVKNLETVIQAFLTVTANVRRRHWRLVIAGDGDPAYRKTLEALAGDEVGAGRITFPGWVSGQEKVDLLDRASVFVQASHQESFGLSIVEAMARGVPVIASRTVNLADEVVGAGAGWVMGTDHGTIAATLGEAIDAREERHRRAVAARAAAERFAWSAIAGTLERLYSNLQTGLAPTTLMARDESSPMVRARRHGL